MLIGSFEFIDEKGSYRNAYGNCYFWKISQINWIFWKMSVMMNFTDEQFVNHMSYRENYGEVVNLHLNVLDSPNMYSLGPRFWDLTPIWNILGTSWSVICGKKIHSHIFISDDVIHRWKFLTLWLFETTGVALFIPHLVWSRDVIILRYHMISKNLPETPGIWWSVICGKRIHS